MGSKVNENVSGIYSLTPLQQAMIYHKLVDHTSGSYFEQSKFIFRGRIDLELVKRSLYLTALRHDVLRSAIIYEKVEKPLQVVFKQKQIEFTLIDILNEDNQKNKIDQIKNDDINRNFDLSKDSVLRVTFIKTGSEEYTAFWSFHHVYLDGWSFGIIFGDFLTFYQMLADGKSEETITLEIAKQRASGNDFGKYMKWLEQQDKSKALEYWKQKVGFCTDVSDFQPLGVPEQTDKVVEDTSITVEKGLYNQLIQLSTSLNTTINTVTEAALGILIYHYSRSNPVVFGKVVSGRSNGIKGINEMAGLFVNTIPVVVNLKEDISVKKYIDDMHQQSVASSTYDYCSLADIQNYSDLKQDLIKILYSFENYYIDDKAAGQELEGIEIEMESAREQTNYDITFMAGVSDSLVFKVIYNPAKYGKGEITNLLLNLNCILAGMAQNPDEKVLELPMITAGDEQRVRYEFNQTDTEYPQEQTVTALFAEQVSIHQDKIAIQYHEHQMSYRDLDQRSDQLAGNLRNHGVKEGMRVVIIAEKNIDTIVSMLAVIKAGGVYVAVDTSYPDERIRYIVSDCNPQIILTNHNRTGLAANCIELLTDQEDSYLKTGYEIKNTNTSQSLINLIYTSGTTGNPKGTMLSHQGVVRLVRNTNYIKFDANTRMLQSGSISFDASTFEIWGALLSGGTLFMEDQDVITDPQKLKTMMEVNKVNTALFTTALCNQMINSNPDVFNSLDTLLIGGEKISEEHIRILKQQNNKIKLINAYGPTETTTIATTYEIPDQFTTIPIGKPISNTKIYLLNHGNLCGIGVPGELCIAGDGLAKGYYNQPELTARVFVENPFGGGKLYRSGDLARWLPDGNLEYLGRIDEQVKIRGFRIELGELENSLRQDPEIVDAAVTVYQKNNDKYICAYYVSNLTVDQALLRERLQTRLPRYMMPSYMMQIKVIPTTGNGKVDKRALPDIEINVKMQYQAPENEEQKKITEIFSKILGLEKVGINDDFFESGGHSLNAMMLVNMIESEFGIRLALKQVFANSKVLQLEKLLQQESGQVYTPIPKAEEKEYYSMSSVQKRMYLINQMEEAKTLYNIPVSMIFNSPLVISKLQSALDQVVQRHEALRTRFFLKDGELVQSVLDDLSVKIQQVSGSMEELTALFESFVQPFDVEKVPLIRMTAVTIGEDKSALFLDMHHIISDGMSMNLLLDEITRIYRGEQLKPLEVQYKDYSEWMKSRDLSEQKAYWMSLFNDDIPVLDVPTDYKRKTTQDYSGHTLEIMMDQEQSKKLRNFVASVGCTDYMVLLSALYLLLANYSMQEDIVVGSVISGRIHKDTEQMMGMFVNTIALRAKPEKDKKVSDFLQEVKDTCLKAFDQQEYPFEELIEAIEINRDLSRNPLFDVMFALQNNEKKDISLTGESIIEGVDSQNVTAKFDLTVNTAVIDDRYMITFEYAVSLFKEETIRRMMNHYLVIIDQMIRYPGQTIKNIEMIDKKEREKILCEFNDTCQEYPKDQTIAAIFYQIAENNPDQTALIFEGQSMSYGELNEKSNALAKTLQQQGLQNEDMVAIAVSKGMGMIIGILAVIKAGGAYVPIDLTYPIERIEYMLDDSNPRILMIEQDDIEFGQRIRKINLTDQKNYQQDVKDLPVTVNPGNLAYMIYTSGTTGRPKGVLVEHHGVVAMKYYLQQLYEICERDVVLQFANYIFDASVWEITMSLLNGATLCIAPEPVIHDNKKFQNYLSEHHVSFALLPPQYYMQSGMKGLKVLTTGGSASDLRLVEKAREHKRYINAYGPTENTVLATHWEYKTDSTLPDFVPIGKPISNTRIYIMNQNRLCGIGVKGELCIAGDGLARGYFNQPEMTAKHFVEIPFATGKMYRSGDLARWHPDGNIEYMGRIDDQVKVRGYRIELEEIEQHLKQIKTITDAAVVIYQDKKGNNRIHAYVVGEGIIDIEKVRVNLQKTLPDYMIPAGFMQIDSIPVNRSGKPDKKSLPEFVISDTKAYVAPRTKKERVLADAFSQTLDQDQVGIDDSFFELGGDSIKAIQIVAKIRESAMELKVKDIMAYKTVKNIANYISETNMLEYSQQEVSGIIPSLPIARMFSERWDFKEPQHFNQSMMLKRESFSREALHSVLKKVIGHHDMLRVVYQDSIQKVLKIDDSKLYSFEEVDFRNVPEEQLDMAVKLKCTEIQASIDLKHGPIVKTALFTTKTAEHFFICIHHLGIDGVSWRILLEDLWNGYEQYTSGKEIKFPLKTASFKEWCETVSDYLNTQESLEQKEYWQSIDAKIAETNLPGDLTDTVRFKEYFVEFEEETTRTILRNAAKKYNVEINDVLLAAIAAAVSQCTGQNEVVINLEGHGRDEIHKRIDVSRTVGWFTISYPLLLNGQGELEEILLSTKETIRKIEGKRFAYGCPEKETELIDISFNYLGQIDSQDQSENQQTGFLTSPLPTGENISAQNRLPGNLIFTGSITGDKLAFLILYNYGKYSDDFISNFIQLFKNTIVAIAAMISGAKEEVITLSDIDAGDLDLEDLSEINEFISGLE